MSPLVARHVGRQASSYNRCEKDIVGMIVQASIVSMRPFNSIISIGDIKFYRHIPIHGDYCNYLKSWSFVIMDTTTDVLFYS